MYAATKAASYFFDQVSQPLTSRMTKEVCGIDVMADLHPAGMARSTLAADASRAQWVKSTAMLHSRAALLHAVSARDQPARQCGLQSAIQKHICTFPSLVYRDGAVLGSSAQTGCSRVAVRRVSLPQRPDHHGLPPGQTHREA